MQIENIGTIPEFWVVLISGAIGYSVKFVIDFFSEKSKKRVELQELYWKEKIEAAKKASEYYLFQVGFFSLTSDKYEMAEESRAGAEQLIESTQELVDSFQKRLLDFPHYEHYHINLFYEFNDEEAARVMKESYECMQNIYAIDFQSSDSLEVFDEKFASYKSNFRQLKINNRKMIDVYQGYLKIIREDIKTLPYK